MKTKFFIGALFLLIAWLSLRNFSFTESSRNRTKKYIAYIGRYTNFKDSLPYVKQEKNKFDLLHEITLKDYLKNLNDSLKQIELELITFDNHRKGNASDSIYKNHIVPNKDILMVIDNTWGENIQECSKTIRENQIPVISTNADKNYVDFGKGVIFTGNDDKVPDDIIAFLSKILKKKSVNFISESDYPLHESFLKAFKDANIEVHHTFELKGKADYSEEQRDSLLTELKVCYHTHDHEPILVINAHKKWGIKILETAEKELKDVSMIGGAFIATLEELKDFGKHSNNELYIMSYPNDALPKKLHNDLERFRKAEKKYFETPSAPFFLKRCLNVFELTQDFIKTKGDTSSLSRKDAFQYTSSLADKTVEGKHDLYKFDSQREMVKELLFTKYKKGKLYSLPIQLSQEREIIPNIFFGIDILDIYDIDVGQNTFSSDFFYWTKVDTGFKKIEENIIFHNIKQTESSKELILEKTDEDILYRLYKVSGKFYNNYELRNYPLDKQELEIKIEILKPVNKLKISFDQHSLDTDQKLLEKFKVPAWYKKRYYFTVDHRITSTMRGDPENDEGAITVFKNFSFHLDIERKFFNPFLEIVLPLSLIGFVAIALLFVRDISFGNLGDVSVGTFLGIITFSIAMSYITPNADYLTKADMYFWLTFVIVLVCFLTIIVINAKYESDEAKNINITFIKYGLGLLYPLLAFVIFIL